MTKHLLRGAAAAAAALALATLAGCWDGGDDDNGTPPSAINEIPDSALVSPTAYTEFALGLETSETAEPFSIDKVTTAPVDDTGEPVDFD
jgi:hypothetical protein